MGMQISASTIQRLIHVASRNPDATPGELKTWEWLNNGLTQRENLVVDSVYWYDESGSLQKDPRYADN
jgi:hypothetical protein